VKGTLIPLSNDVSEAMQRTANDRIWKSGDRVAGYATRTLRPVEVVVLIRYRDELSGRVLELGCGAGRLTGYLAEMARTVHGIDLSPDMVAYSRQRYPRASFSEGDLRDLSAIGDGSWDAVVAAYNVIDVLSDGARAELLDEIARVLAPGGLLVMSSHNRAIAHRLGEPLRLRGRSARETLTTLMNLRRWRGNRRRLLAFERSEPDYAILNDSAHDFSALHYYITRDRQEAQLRAHGFELLEVLDLDGWTVGPGEVSESPELHYIARRGG
jgi:SAM-dependent methyltransferase